MKKLFGTDGIRGIANQEPITAEIGLRLGRAVVQHCIHKGLNKQVVIGRDTRVSGEMLIRAVAAGVLSAGGDALLTDVFPTAGIAYLTRTLQGGAGIVISASHNPANYNGFKIFSHEGYKLNDTEEAEIETLLLSERSNHNHDIPGRVWPVNVGIDLYSGFLKKSVQSDIDLSGSKIIIDCANGATAHVAPPLFSSLGVEVEALFVEPNGININQDCGSEHTEALRHKVLEKKAQCGLAFDGDGDRLIALDESGNVVTGDQLLALYAKMLKEQEILNNNVVVSTVMSNVGLTKALQKLGIHHITTQVGDRHVMEEMRRHGSVLGGENSGHIIFAQDHSTGDGLLAGLKLLSAMQLYALPLSRLAGVMTVYPQSIINVPVSVKPDFSSIPEFMNVIHELERRMGENGRILVRYSGTEPLCRIMVEGEDLTEIDAYAHEISHAVSKLCNP